MSEHSARLLSGPPLDAAVAALAQRNRHHLDAMSASEREEAVATWRELVTTVLSVAGAAADGVGTQAPGAVPGRAVIVVEDAGDEQITVHATFHPDLQELGDGQVSASPAQAAAIELLNSMAARTPPS